MTPFHKTLYKENQSNTSMKTKTRTPTQRARELKRLIADGEKLGFNPLLVMGWKEQLSTTQGLRQAEQHHLIRSR